MRKPTQEANRAEIVNLRNRNASLLAENERLRVALDHLQSWFTADLGGAFSNTEYLLGGCPNDLRAAIERARAALNVTP